jgi:hypothetical protein
VGDCAQGALAHLKRAIELNFDLIAHSAYFPRIMACQPVIRMFDLPSVTDDLLEHAVLVPKPIPHCRYLHRGHGIQKASCQAPKPAIAEPRVRLLLQNGEPIQIGVFDGTTGIWFQEKIFHVVGERSANQKFHREVINPLRVLARIRALGIHPAFRQNLAHRESKCLKALMRGRTRQTDYLIHE